MLASRTAPPPLDSKISPDRRPGITRTAIVYPGRVAIFLMLEIVVGLTTASLLTDEPFGARELIGAVLITGACGVEIGVAGSIRSVVGGSDPGRS